MQTRDKVEEKRDLELENIVGNLLIAEYQVDRLRTRLTDVVSGYRPQLMKNNASTHLFKHNNIEVVNVLLLRCVRISGENLMFQHYQTICCTLCIHTV